MGSRNPDRVPVSARRRKAETVKQMRDQGWEVLAKCSCGRILMRVDLLVIIKVRGPSFSLWNRKTRCRMVGCNGSVAFQGKAPDMTWSEPLDAPWPEP